MTELATSTRQIVQEAVQAIRKARSQRTDDMLACYSVARKYFGYAASREVSRELWRQAYKAAK